MFNNNNESNDDDDFFVPTLSSSSNLANLFGSSHSGAPDLKSPLTYTPPKQPKTNENHLNQQTLQSQQQVQPQKQLICMKAITLSRFIDSKFSIIGKFGIAIIGDNISSDLIIYKTKQNILSTSKLSTNFQYKQINDQIITFIDDQSVAWMVSFDCLKDRMDLIEELEKQGVKKPELTHEPAKPCSINETYTRRLVAEKPEEDKTRAEILGRISKMGLSILPTTESPLNSPISTTRANISSHVDRELSESEPEEVIRTTKMRKLRARHSDSAIETMDLIPKSPGGSQFVPFAKNIQHVALGHHQLMDPLNIYFAENRTHNSEVRMNLSQLGSKIDSLLNELRPQAALRSSGDREYLERRIIELELKVEQYSSPQGAQTVELERKLEQLTKENAQNVLKYDEIITTLRTEQHLLKTALEYERKSKESNKVSTLEDNYKIGEENQKLKATIIELEAIVANQKLKINDFSEYYKEQPRENNLERLEREEAERNEQSLRIQEQEDLQTKLVDLEALAENQKLKIQDFEAHFKQHQDDKLDRLHQEEKEKLRVSDLEAIIANQKLKLEDFDKFFKEHQTCKLDRLQREELERQQVLRCEFLQQGIDEANRKFAELEFKYDTLLESRSKEEDILSELVKQSMNNMYQKVLSDSIDGPSFDARDLKKCLQKHMKSTTFSIIDQYVKYHKDCLSNETTVSSVSPEFEVTV